MVAQSQDKCAFGCFLTKCCARGQFSAPYVTTHHRFVRRASGFGPPRQPRRETWPATAHSTWSRPAATDRHYTTCQYDKQTMLGMAYAAYAEEPSLAEQTRPSSPEQICPGCPSCEGARFMGFQASSLELHSLPGLSVLLRYLDPTTGVFTKVNFPWGGPEGLGVEGWRLSEVHFMT